MAQSGGEAKGLPNLSSGRMRQGFSRGLIYLGILVFLLGDRILQAFARYDFLHAEVIGILAGLALAGLGFGIGGYMGSEKP